MVCEDGRRWPGILRRISCYSAMTVWVLLGLWICVNLIMATKRDTTSFAFHDDIGDFKGGDILSRQKRFVYMDSSRKFRLPTGSILAFSGVLSLPFLGNLPIGYGSGLTIASPLTIKFDDLGLTSPDNRFGYFDIFNLTSRFSMPDFSNFGLPNVVIEYIPKKLTQLSSSLGKFFISHHKKRSAHWKNYPGVNYAGGDREMIFQVVEDLLSSLGIDGQPCLLRTICEMHEEPLFNHGFFGEILELILSPSLAAYAERRFGPYLQAEKHGKEKKECAKYRAKCKYSIFTAKTQYGRFPHLHNVTYDERENYLPNDISNATDLSYVPHHREKRFFAFGPARRLIFPPSTAAVLTTTLNLPFLRDLPEGYSSQLSYSVPMSLSFDLLGLTSALNLFGQLPFLKKKRKRDIQDALDGINYAGGDREMMYAVAINSLTNIGMDGEACLKRIICEIHEIPLVNHGIFGEVLTIFLTPSLAPKARERLSEFVKAEQIGKKCGSCGLYSQKCSWSLFTNPGAGVKYRNKSVLKECERENAFEYRQETMDLVTSFKVKYRQAKKKVSTPPSTKFVNEIAHDMNMKALFKHF